jgi:glycosyltransferase involved in cell wall biosynthesis
MPKIIICSPLKKNIVGGVERFCYLLKDCLVKNNLDVEIIGRENVENNFLWKIFKKIKGLDLIVLGYLLGKLADKLKPDLVITNGLYGFSAKTKSINIEHGTFARASDRIDKNIFKKIIRKYFWGHFEKLAVKKAKKVVAVSRETKESIQKYYQRKDVEIILNAIDINLFFKKDSLESRKVFNLPEDKKLVLFVGRLSYEKSPEIIYELAKKFEKEKTYFVLATDRILNWDLKNTIFLLNVPYERLPYLYSACDIFILPSKHEGFGLTSIEAMACESLFLISEVGVAGEIKTFNSEFRKFIIEEKDLNPKIWYDKIKKVLNLSAEEKQKYQKLSREFVEKNCSIEIFERKYLELIKNVLNL